MPEADSPLGFNDFHLITTPFSFWYWCCFPAQHLGCFCLQPHSCFLLTALYPFAQSVGTVLPRVSGAVIFLYGSHTAVAMLLVSWPCTCPPLHRHYGRFSWEAVADSMRFVPPLSLCCSCSSGFCLETQWCTCTKLNIWPGVQHLPTLGHAPAHCRISTNSQQGLQAGPGGHLWCWYGKIFRGLSLAAREKTRTTGRTFPWWHPITFFSLSHCPPAPCPFLANFSL